MNNQKQRGRNWRRDLVFFVGVVAYGMPCFLPGREVTHELGFHTVVWLNVGPQSYRGWFITRLATGSMVVTAIVRWEHKPTSNWEALHCRDEK